MSGSGFVFSGTCSWVNFYARFHSRSFRPDLIQKIIRIFRSDAKLFCGKGENRFSDFRHCVQPAFHSGCAVGAVQILDDIDLFYQSTGIFFLTHNHPPISFRVAGKMQPFLQQDGYGIIIIYE